MKFSEEILRGFDLEPEEEKEPVNVMQIEANDYIKLVYSKNMKRSDFGQKKCL